MLAFWVPIIGHSQTTPKSDTEPVKTSITVMERVSAEAPASLTVLGAPQVEQAPGINMDDRLRLVPGFSLFRRSSSLVANPTTQGVSLRGLGSSGASRSVVLWDGVPLNSPFGGWIYWTRVNPEEVERVEISRGASTSVFGDKAMGGAVTMFSREPQRTRLWFGYEGGNTQSHTVEGGGSVLLGQRWAFSGNGRGYSTDGYYIVPEYARGPIDTKANIKFFSGTARVDYFSGKDRLFLRVDALGEERDNGTTLTQNSTGLGTVAANYTREQGSSTYTLLGYHTREEYRATFSSIGAGRRTENLTLRQTVPAEATGGAGLWRRSGRKWNLLSGGDFVRSEGYSLERLPPTISRIGGGTQLQFGLFSQGDVAFGPMRLFGGLRGSDAGNGTAFWSPSGGVTVGLERWRFRTTAYRAFRAPTLNELYRQFRVGNALTLANADLKPETLRGVETGVDFTAGTTRVSLTAFDNRLDALVTNVTLSVTPTLITRQRANAGAATARGLEANVMKRWGGWRAEASYLLADSRYAAGPRVPQIPRHQGSALLTWTHKRTLVSGGLRAASLQFEDDLNNYLLPGFAVLHLTARQELTQQLMATFALENALDRVYAVGYSPTVLTGAPRLWRVGLRWNIR